MENHSKIVKSFLSKARNPYLKLSACLATETPSHFERLVYNEAHDIGIFGKETAGR